MIFIIQILVKIKSIKDANYQKRSSATLEFCFPFYSDSSFSADAAEGTLISLSFFMIFVSQIITMTGNIDVIAAFVVHFKNFYESPFLYALISSSAASHSSDSKKLGMLYKMMLTYWLAHTSLFMLFLLSVGSI